MNNINDITNKDINSLKMNGETKFKKIIMQI